MVEEVVRAQADRVRLAGVLQKIIGDDEEVLRRQNRLSIVNTHLLGRDRDHPGVHVDGGEVERSGQSLDVDVRLHLRGDDEDQILALGERLHASSVVLAGQERQVIRHRTNPLDQLLRVGLGRRQGPQVGDLHVVEAAVILVLSEQRAGQKELIPLIGRRRRRQNLRQVILKTRLVQERTTQLIPVHRDLVVLLAVHRVELRGDIRLVSAEDVLLHVVALGVVGVGGDQTRLHLLDRVTEVQHAPLELPQRIVPRDVTGDVRADTVDQGVGELVEMRGVRGQVLNDVGDTALRSRRDAPLIVRGGVVTDPVQDLNVIEVANATAGERHGQASLGLEKKEAMLPSSPSSASLVSSLPCDSASPALSPPAPMASSKS
ncbi:hypothetical protein CN359_30465 [Bacillus thuringiensis]|nr:hypothetical protein CN359_30465 [Bacillus thuringiensis]